MISMFIGEAQAQSTPGAPPPGGFPGGNVPGGGFPGGRFPGGGIPGGAPRGAMPGGSVTQPAHRSMPAGQPRQSAPAQPRGGLRGATAPGGRLPSGPVTPAILEGIPLAVTSPVLVFPNTALPLVPAAPPIPREIDTRPIVV